MIAGLTLREHANDAIEDCDGCGAPLVDWSYVPQRWCGWCGGAVCAGCEHDHECDLA